MWIQRIPEVDGQLYCPYCEERKSSWAAAYRHMVASHFIIQIQDMKSQDREERHKSSDSDPNVRALATNRDKREVRVVPRYWESRRGPDYNLTRRRPDRVLNGYRDQQPQRRVSQEMDRDSESDWETSSTRRWPSNQRSKEARDRRNERKKEKRQIDFELRRLEIERLAIRNAAMKDAVKNAKELVATEVAKAKELAVQQEERRALLREDQSVIIERDVANNTNTACSPFQACNDEIVISISEEDVVPEAQQ